MNLKKLQHYKLREIQNIYEFAEQMKRKGYTFGAADKRFTPFYKKGELVGIVSYCGRGLKYLRWTELINS